MLKLSLVKVITIKNDFINLEMNLSISNKYLKNVKYLNYSNPSE